LAPLKVSVPPDTTRPPVPEIAPDKVPLAAVSVRVFAPRVTAPEPDKVVIDVLVGVMPEILNVPESTIPIEFASDPLPESARTPALIVVAPV